METKDQTGRRVKTPENPQRILSLVPSITELLFELRLDERMVGRTRFCVYPSQRVERIPVIGGVMGLNSHEIDKIAPDLILASREENARNEVMDLARRHPVWVSDVHNLDDALQMIESIGEICGVTKQATDIKTNIEEAFHKLDHIPPDIVRAVYLVWKDPLYTVNRNTFIHDMMARCGIENVFADKEDSYPIIREKEIRERKPDFILLPNEPYNFQEHHRRKFSESFPQTEVKRVQGEYFTWYGSHLLNAPSYFKQLF